MEQKKKQTSRNTKIAILFFVFLIFIVGLSLAFKAVDVIRRSQFDDSRRFTLSIANNRNIEVMSLSPSLGNIVIFKLSDNFSSAEAGHLLKIPIDGQIFSKSQDLNKKTDSLFVDAILNYKNIQTDLTIIDLLKLAIFARTIPENAVDIKMVENKEGLDVERTVGRLVIDNFIEKDFQTIQVVNGTEVNGLGNRLAKLITNMGGNVILVMTEDKPRKKSVITYIDKKTYTVERLQEVLGYEAVKEPSNAISDITVIIGEDRLEAIPF
jgi:hypothetical protein